MFLLTDINDVESFVTSKSEKYFEQVIMSFSFLFQRDIENRQLEKLPMDLLPERRKNMTVTGRNT